MPTNEVIAVTVPEQRRPQKYDPRSAMVELQAALGAARISVDELWIEYVSVGGTMSRAEHSAVLANSSLPSESQYTQISEALDEHFKGAEFAC
jgi:hypothetical protein